MKKYIILLIVIAISGCSQQRFSKVDEQAIRNVISQQQDGWNSGSIEEYMQGYEQSDSVRFISGGTVTYGWKTVLDRYMHAYPDKEAMGELHFSEIQVEPLSNNYAIAYGKWELKRTEDLPWGMFSLLFRKMERGWHIVHDHTSLAR